MNLEKLKDAEAYFYELYPKGFEDEAMAVIRKRHNTAKISEQVHEMFSKDKFGQPELICEAYSKIVSKSSLISLFEKPKVRDMVKGMSVGQKDMLSIALYELLYGDKKEGFNDLIEILAENKLAKWSLVSLLPYYFYRDKEYFIKPTTTKNVIKHFELPDLVYKPRPSFEFYEAYTKVLEQMKKKVNINTTDNAAFTGFLMISMEDNS